MEYFILVNGENQCPFSVETLKGMGITPDALVWTQGMEQWAPAGQIFELQQLFAPQQQPQPQPQQGAPQQGAPQQGAPQPAFQQQFQQQFQQKSGPGIKEFFTDEYEKEEDVPALKKGLNKFLGWIDNGLFFREPLRIAYIVFGVLVALSPIYVFIKLIESHYGYSIFSEKPVPSIIVMVVLIPFAIFGLLFWINRSKKVKTYIEKNDDFVAIPLAAHVIQSAGEFYGIFMGTVVPLLVILLALTEGRDLTSILPFGIESSFGGALQAAVYSILLGFFIIIVSRAAAEAMRALASIANNVKKMTKSNDNHNVNDNDNNDSN